MKTPKKRSLIIIAVIILVMVIVLSSFFYLTSQKPYNGKVEPVTIGFFNSEMNALVYIADDQQYFAANGLNVTIRNYNSGAAAVNGLLSGEVDITGASEFVVAQKGLENANLYTFGSYCKSDKFYLVGRTDRGIENISDLKGKTIGVPLGTNGEFYFGRFLELNNINLIEVNLVNVVPFIQTPDVLANGTVDAAVAFQPYINQIESLLGNKTVMWPIQNNQLAYIDAICTRSWGADHPDLIERFLKAIVQAENFGVNHQEKAIVIVAKTLNYSSEYLTTVWPDYQFSVSLDQAQLLAMQDEAQWLISNHLTNATKFPNFINFVYEDGLKSLKPGAVNIIG
jgi:ABC-type nitrate/sulfonate/bicarbonate transport system substrate-binding protein